MNNIENGIRAIFKSGIKIQKEKNIPYFHCDSNNPNIIIRELNSKVEKGNIINGKFKVI